MAVLASPRVASRTRPVTALLALAPFLANADAGIVSLAMPDIQRDLGMSLSGVHWVTNLYVLIVGGLQLLGGRLTDRVGSRRLFLLCLAAFALASAACGAAPTGELLLVSRAAQAAAAAFLVPAAMAALITSASTPAQRSRALVTWVGVGGAGSVCGVLLGGYLVSELDWRWAFFLNLPVIAVAWAAAWRLLPRDSRTHDLPVGLTGALMLTGALVTLIHTLVQPHLVGLVVFVLLGGGFAVLQVRGRPPVLPLCLMRDRGLASGSISVLLVSAVTSPIVYGGSLYLQRVQGHSALVSGLALLPVVGGVVLVGPLCKRLMRRFGTRAAQALGCLLVGAGLLTLSGIAPDAGYVTGFLPGMALAGAGLPLIWMTAETTALATTSTAVAGSAAGLLQASGHIGAALGLAMTVTLSHGGLVEGVPSAFLIAAALMALALLNALTSTPRGARTLAGLGRTGC